MKKKIKEQMDQLADYEVKILNAKDEVDYLADENDELGREIECRTMYGEDIEERLRIIAEGGVKSMEYSRFLEEQLFAARKLQTTAGARAAKSRQALQGGSMLPSRMARVNTAVVLEEDDYNNDGNVDECDIADDNDGGDEGSGSDGARSGTPSRSRRDRVAPIPAGGLISQIELARTKKKMLESKAKKSADRVEPSE